MAANFSKDERLKRQKVIQALFDRKGSSFGQYPLRLVWMPIAEPQGKYPVQFGVSVPKRRFKKAADRNRLKRRIREAYRVQKQRIYDALENEPRQFAFMIIYIGKDAVSFSEIERSMQQIIRRFMKKVLTQ